MVKRIYGFFWQLLHHRHIIRSLQAEIAALEGELAKLRAAAPSPPKRVAEVDTKPIRFKRRTSFAEEQALWESAHNRRLTEQIERQKAGYL